VSASTDSSQGLPSDNGLPKRQNARFALTAAGVLPIILWLRAGIAQLVERNLAKVEVASSSLVSRSNEYSGESSAFPVLFYGGVAEWSCSGLQSRVRRFDSDPRLQAINRVRRMGRDAMPILVSKIRHDTASEWHNHAEAGLLVVYASSGKERMATKRKRSDR
jgi:hypothetical protein